MRCISEEESEEINNTMDRFNNSEAAKEIEEKLREPDIDEIAPSSIYHKSREARALIGALAAYAAGFRHGQSSSYVAEYTPINIKGAPGGKYNKEKHMSRAQRKKMKSRRNK